MCLLVVQKKGKVMSDKHIENAFESNPHGSGYSYIVNNSLQTKKFRRLSKFLKNFKSDVGRYGDSSPFLIHFRWATHGSNEGTLNVHPFKVRKGLVFAHNGVINDVSDSTKYSDTQMFNFEILQKLNDDFLNNKAYQVLIEKMIGSSKLGFLTSEGKIKIMNERLGHWKDGIWYSNEGYKDKVEICNVGYGWGSYGNSINQYFKKESEFQYCEWCGSDCEKTELYDMSKDPTWGDDEPYEIEMCPDCLSYERKRAIEHEMSGDMAHFNINTKEIN